MMKNLAINKLLVIGSLIFFPFVFITGCEDKKGAEDGESSLSSGGKTNKSASRKRINNRDKLKFQRGETLKQSDLANLIVTVAKLSDEEIKSILDGFSDADYAANNGFIWSVYVTELARRSPQDAVERILQFPNTHIQFFHHLEVFKVLGGEAPDLLFKAAMKINEGSSPIEKAFAIKAISGLQKTHPESGMRIAKHLGLDAKMAWICAGVAMNDVDRAIAMAEKNIEKSHLNEAMAGIAQAASKKNLSLSLKILGKLPKNDNSVTDTYRRIFSDLVREDAELAMDSLLTLDEASLMASVANETVLRGIMTKNSERGIEVISKLLLTQSTSHVYDAALRILAEKNPQEAMDWLSGFEKSQSRNQLQISVYKQWASSNLTEAISSIESLDEVSRKVALKGVGTSWGKKDLDAAVKWGQKLTDATERKNLIASALVSAVYQDPAKAAEYLTKEEVVSNLNVGERASFMENAAAQYYTKDVDETIEWVSNLGGKDQVAAVKGMVNKWASKDIDGLGKWLEKMEPGVLRDTGVKAMINQLKNTHPEAAKAWAATLSEKP